MGRQKFPWTRKHEDCLLSHLELVIHILEEENHRKAPKEKVLQTLEDELPQPKPTRREIKGRLIKIWRQYNSNTSKWYSEEDIYIEGILALPDLDQDRNATIVREFKTLKLEHAKKVERTPRKIRSGRVLGAKSTGSEAVCELRTPTKSERKRRIETQNKHSFKRIKTNQENLKGPSREVMVVISRLQEPISERSPSTVTPVSRPSTADGLERPRCISRSIESIRKATASDTSSSHDFQRHEMLSRPFSHAARKSNVQSNHTNGERVLNLAYHGFGDAQNDLVLDLFNDNWHLRKALEASEIERKTMAENHRVQRLVQLTNLPSAVKEQNQTIVRNQMIIDDHHFARPFLGEKPGRHTKSLTSRILCIHEDMERNILDFATIGQKLLSVENILTFDGEDFCLLRDKVLSSTRRDPLGRNAAHPLDIWVQSFIGAALCQWVFAKSYEGVAVMSTPLLYAYRRALRMLCPEDFMTLIECVAHQCLIDNEHFKQAFLKRSAETYAERFRTALDPLLRKELLPLDYKFDEELVGIFLSALEIKMLGMAPEREYAYVWPSRNAEFDYSTMARDPTAIDNDNQHLENQKVMITLVPGIKVCGVSVDKEGEFELIARARVITC